MYEATFRSKKSEDVCHVTQKSTVGLLKCSSRGRLSPALDGAGMGRGVRPGCVTGQWENPPRGVYFNSNNGSSHQFQGPICQNMICKPHECACTELNNASQTLYVHPNGTNMCKCVDVIGHNGHNLAEIVNQKAQQVGGYFAEKKVAADRSLSGKKIETQGLYRNLKFPALQEDGYAG